MPHNSLEKFWFDMEYDTVMRAIRDVIFGDNALLYIAYVTQQIGGAAVDPQLIPVTADNSST